MHRRTLLTTAAAGLSLGLAGCNRLRDSDTLPDDTVPPESERLVNGSFEDDLTGWARGTDLPSKPGESTEPVDHSITTSTDRASDGDTSLALTLSGRADDGTIWVEQRVDFTDHNTLAFDVHNPQESFNILTQTAVFVGEKPEDGLTESDFDRSNDIEAEAGWTTYTVDVSHLSGTGVVAIGMNIVWETTVKHHFDNIRLTDTDTTTQPPESA